MGPAGFTKRKWYLVFSVIATLTACNGSGGGTGTDTDTDTPITPVSPAVSSTSPAAGATGVPLDFLISATFDTDIFAVTVDGSSFTLSRTTDAARVNGAVSFDGTSNTATFTPASALALSTRYTATLTTAITDLSGNALASDVSWSFTTADGAWGTAELIGPNGGRALDPQIAFSANGDAIAVWYQEDGVRTNIWANRYEAGTGWGAAELIETDNTGGAYNPQIAFDANGNALAVWYQYDGTRNNVWSNRYTAGVGWGVASLLESDDTDSALNPQIDFDANGNALAVWTQSDGTLWSIWVNRYVAGVGWGAATLIESNNTANTADPQIAFDSHGNALAVWSQDDGASSSLWANRYVAGVGWGVEELISSNTDYAFFPQIDFDSNGNALVVWQQDSGGGYDIWANRYVAGIGWDTAELLETDDADSALYPQVAFDTDGNALAVWQQSDGTQPSIWANRYEAGTGWGTAALIESHVAGRAEHPQIAFDGNGNALAVWRQYDGSVNNIWSNRYTADTGWGVAGLVETNETDQARFPQIAIHPTGNALAVWEQVTNGTYSIWANEFE